MNVLYGTCLIAWWSVLMLLFIRLGAVGVIEWNHALPFAIVFYLPMAYPIEAARAREGRI